MAARLSSVSRFAALTAAIVILEHEVLKLVALVVLISIGWNGLHMAAGRRCTTIAFRVVDLERVCVVVLGHFKLKNSMKWTA